MTPAELRAEHLPQSALSRLCYLEGNDAMSEIKFEEALKKLEKIVGDLEAGKLPLDESLKKYEEGIKLVQSCSRILETAQKKVEVLTKKDGSFQLKTFEEDPAEAA